MKLLSEEAQRIFARALTAIQRKVRSADSFRLDLLGRPGLLLDDLLGLEVQFLAGPPGALFDHQLHRRRFVLHDNLTAAYERYWSTHRMDEADRLLMAELFLLHELVHVRQSAHSDVYYSGGPSSLDLFSGLDYAADAAALLLAHELETSSGRVEPAATLWVRLMAAQMRGGMVFSEVDRVRQTVTEAPNGRDRMEGARLRRQMCWALQYARADAYLPESTGWQRALEARIELTLGPMGLEGIGTDLFDQSDVSLDRLSPPLQLNANIGDRMLRHAWTHPRETEALAAMLFAGDLSQWSNAFRSLFDHYPFLTGRAELQADTPPAAVEAGAVVQTPPAPASSRKVTVNLCGAKLENGSAGYVENMHNHFAKPASRPQD